MFTLPRSKRQTVLARGYLILMGGRFTLIEMLVVIAIIAILAAMLMPSLMKARKSAIAVACVNNLKQNGIAFMMYANDYGGYYPGFGTDSPNLLRGKGAHYRNMDLKWLLQAYERRNLELASWGAAKTSTWLDPGCTNRDHWRNNNGITDVCYGVNSYQYGLHADATTATKNRSSNLMGGGVGTYGGYNNAFRNAFRAADYQPRVHVWTVKEDTLTSLSQIELLSEQTNNQDYYLYNSSSIFKPGYMTTATNGQNEGEFGVAFNHGERYGRCFLFLDGTARAYNDVRVSYPRCWNP
jgi:prepilin-type N-terminal cleavage/methylation domain-containing protein